MKLEPEVTELRGKWCFDGTSMVKDTVCSRIEYLTESILEKIAESPEWGAWEILYRDPNDGRFWELTYPEGHMQGGGPPRLAIITFSKARSKYNLKS